jgi:monothiol glutaredoxin
MKIKAYISKDCAWSGGVCAILEKYGLAYAKLDVSDDHDAYAEMKRKSGQMNTPCIEIDGVFLADISGQEVEDYLLSHQLVGEKSKAFTTQASANDRNIAGARLASQTQFF